ncbi:MAG: TonB-dependent receptor [Pseudomonadota bacterium]
MKQLILATIIMAPAIIGATIPIQAKANTEQRNSEIDLWDLSIEDLAEIKLTAQKREQQWYTIPLTVDVYEGRNLRDNNVHHFSQLSQLAPGLLYGHIGASPQIYLRGIGSDLISIAADSRIAIYSDDVYLARPQMAIAQFWDLDRIEILKGPQGALYGRNATGGAINIIHARPTFDRVDAYANVSVGNFSTRQVEAAVGAPLTDSLAIRTSIFATKDNGFTQDIDARNGNKIDNNDSAAARIELRWQLTDALENSLTAEHYQNNNNSYSFKPVDNKGLAEALGAIPVTDFHQTRNDLFSYNDYQTQGLSWRWLWNPGAFEFTSITAYRNLDLANILNTDGTEIAITASQLAWNSSQRSQEFKFTSTNAGNWHWLAGASWLNETPTNDLGQIRTPLNTSNVTHAYADTTAWSFYGEVEWAFQPQWLAKLGLRESNETRKDGNTILSTHDLLGLDSNFENATASGASQHDESFSKLSPQFVLSFIPGTVSGHSLWYLSATEGFKSGGANSFSTRASFKPEDIISIETGFKYSEKKISWQLAAFHYDYKDLQVLTFENGVTSIANATDAKINGVDANLQWTINNQWTWKTGVTALNANYQKFITSAGGVAVDVSDNTMPHAPTLDFNQALHYHHPLAIGKLQLSLQHHYQSRTYFNQFSDKVVSEPARNILNTRILWNINSHWDLAVNVTNLTNENYYETLARFASTSIASAPEGNAVGVTAPGRLWLAQVNYKF